MSNHMLSYKGYTGAVEVDFDAGIIHGQVLYLRDVITFQGKTPEDVEKAFRESIDEYLEFCAELGDEPEKPKPRKRPQLQKTLKQGKEKISKG